MGSHNVKPHTRQGKPVRGSTRKNPGSGKAAAVVDAGRQDQARAAALTEVESSTAPTTRRFLPYEPARCCVCDEPLDLGAWQLRTPGGFSDKMCANCDPDGAEQD